MKILVPFILITIGGFLSLVWWRLPLERMHELGVLLATWSIFMSTLGLGILLGQWLLRVDLDCK